MPLTNAIFAQLSGVNHATARGHQAASVTALCRLLLAAGHDPAARLLAYRNGTLAIRVKSIGAGARLTVDTDRFGCPKFRLWKGAPGDVAGSLIELQRNSDRAQGGISKELLPCA